MIYSFGQTERHPKDAIQMMIFHNFPPEQREKKPKNGMQLTLALMVMDNRVNRQKHD